MTERTYTKHKENGTWVGTLKLASGDLVEIDAYDGPYALSGSVTITLKAASGKLGPVVYWWDDWGFYTKCKSFDQLARSAPGDLLKAMADLEKGHSGAIAAKVYAELLGFLPHNNVWDEWLEDGE